MDAPKQPKKPKSPARHAYDFLSGFPLATALLLLLGLLTWFATLEQIDKGLYPTLNKYFHWKSIGLLPEINGKLLPLPLPGGYWVSALLVLNMTLGGIVRIRKGWRQAGNIISHFGIIFMLLGGGRAPAGRWRAAGRNCRCGRSAGGWQDAGGTRRRASTRWG